MGLNGFWGAADGALSPLPFAVQPRTCGSHVRPDLFPVEATASRTLLAQKQQPRRSPTAHGRSTGLPSLVSGRKAAIPDSFGVEIPPADGTLDPSSSTRPLPPPLYPSSGSTLSFESANDYHADDTHQIQPRGKAPLMRTPRALRNVYRSLEPPPPHDVHSSARSLPPSTQANASRPGKSSAVVIEEHSHGVTITCKTAERASRALPWRGRLRFHRFRRGVACTATSIIGWRTKAAVRRKARTAKMLHSPWHDHDAHQHRLRYPGSTVRRAHGHVRSARKIMCKGSRLRNKKRCASLAKPSKASGSSGEQFLGCLLTHGSPRFAAVSTCLHLRFCRVTVRGCTQLTHFTQLTQNTQQSDAASQSSFAVHAHAHACEGHRGS